jgi:PAS domain S-box-containing protein
LIIAVWVGLALPRWVNVAFVPLYALTYWLPLSLHLHSSSLAPSVLAVVGVAVAGRETVAWLTARLACVSARLQSQDQLRFAALDGESSEVRAVVDPQGTVVHVSASVESIFGYQVAEIRGHHGHDVMATILYPDDLVGAEAALDAAKVSSTGRESFVARILHADKTLRYADVKVRNLLADDAAGFVLLDCWDVTDRVEARIRLGASEESFRLLFQLSPLPTIVCDPIGLRCLRVNDAACAHYGYTHEEFLDMTLVDVLPTADEPARPGSRYEPPGGFLRPGPWQHQTKDGPIRFQPRRQVGRRPSL